MSLREKAIRGVLWSGIQNWGTGLISTVVIVILARLLDQADWGLIAYATIYIEFFAVIQRQGFAQALIQRSELEEGHRNAAFWISVFTGMLFGALVFFGADLIATIGEQEGLASVLRWLSVVVLVEAIGTTPQALLRRRLAFRSLAVRSLAGTSIGGAVGVGMAFSGYGVWSLVGQQIAGSVASAIAVWAASRWRPSLKGSRQHVADLLGFGMFTMGRGVVNYFNRRVDYFLIGVFLGVEALGVYDIARRLLVTLNRLFTQTVSTVALPTFSRLQHDHAQMRQALLTATRMASLLAFPAFLGVSALAPQLVAGLFGPEWEESAPLMRILALSGLVQCIVFFNSPTILACGKPSWVFATSVGHALVGITLYLIAAQWGVLAVAVARTLRNFILAGVPLLLVRRLIGLRISEYLGGYVAPLGSSLAMVVVVWAVARALGGLISVQAVLVVSVAAGVVAYFTCMRFWAPDRLRQAGEYVRLAVGAKTA